MWIWIPEEQSSAFLEDNVITKFMINNLRTNPLKIDVNLFVSNKKSNVINVEFYF